MRLFDTLRIFLWISFPTKMFSAMFHNALLFVGFEWNCSVFPITKFFFVVVAYVSYVFMIVTCNWLPFLSMDRSFLCLFSKTTTKNWTIYGHIENSNEIFAIFIYQWISDVFFKSQCKFNLVSFLFSLFHFFACFLFRFFWFLILEFSFVFALHLIESFTNFAGRMKECFVVKEKKIHGSKIFHDNSE